MPGDRRDKALQALDSLKGSQRSALAHIRAHAITMRRAGHEVGANRLALQAIALSRHNLTIANARRKLSLAVPLAPQTAALLTLAAEGETTATRLNSISNALEQATRLVEIVGRILTVLR